MGGLDAAAELFSLHVCVCFWGANYWPQWAKDMLDQYQSDPSKQIRIDHRLGEYKHFFDFAWIEEFAAAAQISRLNQIALDLASEWKGIALTNSMPWLTIDSVKKSHDGYFESNPRFCQELSKAFGNYVTNRSTLSNMREKELIGIVQQLGKEIQNNFDNSKPPFDPEEMWNDFLKVHSFSLGLWSQQRISYGAIYFAYENFITNCIAVGKNDAGYQASRIERLIEDFTQLFDEDLANQCLKDRDVTIARLARNCLTHSGGRVSSKLQEMNHQILVEANCLQIFPKDVRDLFNLLKSKVLKIVVAAVQISVFGTGT